MPLKSYRELRVWRAAMALAKDLYRLTAAFPELERYGLTSQLRRGAVSVPSNIAEGYSRASRREYLRFLGMARSAIAEIETQLMLARDLDMAAEAEILTVLTG